MEAVAAGHPLNDHIPELRVSPRPFHTRYQLFQRHSVNVGSKEIVEGLLRLAYTGSGLGCLHNFTIALRVIILRRERVESEEKVGRRGTD